MFFGGNADPSVVEFRVLECERCEDNIKGTCDVCGCNIKLKTKWYTEECPLNKW